MHREELEVHTDDDGLYYLDMFYEDKECYVHLLYYSSADHFEYEVHPNSGGIYLEEIILKNLTTASEEELFQYSTVYDYSKYCTLERLKAIQYGMKKVHAEDDLQEKYKIHFCTIEYEE